MARRVRVEAHPDGMQAKYFDIAGWLEAQGCKEVAERGRTRGTGVYRHAAETLEIDFRSVTGGHRSGSRGRPGARRSEGWPHTRAQPGTALETGH